MLKKVGAGFVSELLVFATGNRNAICENDDPTTISYHLGDKIMILQLLSYGGQNAFFYLVSSTLSVNNFSFCFLLASSFLALNMIL